QNQNQAQDQAPDQDQLPAEAMLDRHLAEQKILFDGKHVYALAETRSGLLQGDVYFDFNRQKVLRGAGLPFENPVQLWTEALNIERADLRQALLRPLVGGGFMGLLTRDTYRLKFYFFDRFGYDLRRVSSYRRGEDVPFRDCLLSWQEADGLHYVHRYVSKLEEHSPPGEAAAPSRRVLEVEYRSFEANGPIDQALFRLPALEIPAGTPFDDHRVQVNGQPRRLHFDGSGLQEMAAAPGLTP
ncbi:MAG: hypothetical protein KDA45_16065, partial [Planctomycetales bacterium]|nr:hypothetical protein [Planctomycetales bacterium]